LIASNPGLDRVRRIAYWSPEREPRVLWIRAHDGLAFTIAVAFACLGVERVLIQPEPGFEGAVVERWVAAALRRWLQRVELEVVPQGLDELALELMLETQAVDAVVACSPDPALRAACAALEIPHYAVAGSGSRFAFASGEAAEELPGDPQPIQLETAFAAAGFVSHDFAWRHVLHPAATLPEPRFAFDLSHPFAPPGSRGELPQGALPEPLSVLLVGAGGLGCPAGLCLSRRLPRGSRVVVCDFDRVDATNSRQFLFRLSDVHHERPKAVAFCREMERVAPHVAWVPVAKALPHPEIVGLGPYDVALGFTDTLRSRAELDRMDLAPLLLHAAVDPESATSGLFLADSVRLSEALDLERASEQEGGRASCAEAEPSIVSTNFIGASLALAQLWSHCSQGPAPSELVSYEVGASTRGGRWPVFQRAPRAAPAPAERSA
jgi:hypothetical protein